MSRKFRMAMLGLVAFGLAVGAVTLVLVRPPELPDVVVPATQPTQGPEMFPWREREADLKRFFPGATGTREEARILSAQRMELKSRLGRPPTPEEHLLYLHRVVDGTKPLGSVIVRRLSGRGGGLELVIAADPKSKVVGMRLQRIRESAAVTKQLEAPSWLAAFRGKTASSDWTLGKGIPAVSAEAAESANVIATGVRDTLILLEVAETHGLVAPPEPNG